MGYRRQPTIYRLLFEEYEGLEVMARSVSIDEYLKITRLADEMTTRPGEEQVKEMFAWFAKRLVSWNLEDEDGTPVPATLHGLLGEELPFATAIVMAWVNKVVRVDPTSPPGSSPGASPPDPLEASIPMEPVTESPPSS